MEKKVIYYTDANGNKVPIEVDLNKSLGKKPKKDSKLRKKIATRTIALTLGVGVLIGGAVLLLKGCDVVKEQTPTTSTTAPTLDELNEGLRFDPNTKESVIENAVLLIGEAARGGKELDAEDAVLAVIAANSNELNVGFMGELFGERADQTYTYSSIVDAYLRVCMIQNENVGIAKDDEIAFNIENIFANEEDYNFLCQIRDLTTRFNNSADEKEKDEITNQLNQIAEDLCGYDVYDISSPAGIISMLTLDGMRTVTVSTDNPILHDDIRDEMFGNGDYACEKEGTFSTTDGKVLQTAYSFRVGDLKLDTIKTKLENAILVEGKTVIFDEIISQVKEQTKDVEIADFGAVDETNKEAEENREIPYEYESAPGTEKENYSEKTDNDVVTNVDGKDVIVVPEDSVVETTQPKEEETKPSVEATRPTTPATEPEAEETEPVIEPTIQNPEVTTPIEPDITIEENVATQPNEEVVDVGNVEENKQEAEDNVLEDWEKAQSESDQGSKDGERYGQNGLPKPSFEGKSEYYINAFNMQYDFWYSIYQQALAATEPTAAVETYDLDGLSKEQLDELKNAALGEEEYTQTGEKEKTK